jgi:hypothetical protein
LCTYCEKDEVATDKFEIAFLGGPYYCGANPISLIPTEKASLPLLTEEEKGRQIDMPEYCFKDAT